MSRLPTDSASTGDDRYRNLEKKPAETIYRNMERLTPTPTDYANMQRNTPPEVIALREALGAIPEVAKTYGTVDVVLKEYYTSHPPIRDDDSFSEVSEDESEEPIPASTTEAEIRFNSARKETSARLARLGRFLPQNMLTALDGKLSEALKLANARTDEAYDAATKALTKLQSTLDDKAPQLNAAENKHLRTRVQQTLDRDVNVLVQDEQRELVTAFKALDKDLPTDAGDADRQLQALRELASDIDNAIKSRLKAISDLCVDYERLKPIIARALSIESDVRQELQQANAQIEAGFAGQFIRDGLSLADIQAQLRAIESQVRNVFANFTPDQALQQQRDNLPVSADEIKQGRELGRGHFGAVYELKHDGDKKLVGKQIPANNQQALDEMKHEAAVYARIGEHPNIAKCYGIHEIDGSSMLVMDKIEGDDVGKVLDDLNVRYRDQKISHEEYLAATQHIIKGTLMGLAHMESMGLVHKDLKGDNIKFDNNTHQAVLIDMGLAQQEGEHEKGMFYFSIAPPEQDVREDGDKIVSPAWDTYTVGKLLFEQMERGNDGSRNTLITGSTPKASNTVTRSVYDEYTAASRKALERTGPNQWQARTDSQGQLVGQALKPADDPNHAAAPGNFGAATAYVDFMNRLTHPDPNLRMSATEALKHPFLADSLLSPEQLERVFSKPDEDDDEVPAAPPTQYANLAHELATDGVEVSFDSETEESEDSDDDTSELQPMRHVGNNYWVTQGPEDQALEDSLAHSNAGHEEDELEAEPIEGDSSAEESPDDAIDTFEYANVPRAETDSDDAKESEDEDTVPVPPPMVGATSSTSSTDGASDNEAIPQAPPQVTRPAQNVEAVLTQGTTASRRWEIAQQQVEQQFKSAYAVLADDKAKLKAAGFTKGKKFSDYFTYNKGLGKLIKSLEAAKKKSSKDVPKLVKKVTEATSHYREKINRKADTDFGWANAQPAVTPPFWKTLAAALDDVDKWAKS